MARLPITTISKTSTSEVLLNYLTAVNGTPAADQFRSTITGRSKMIDFTSDLLPRMGVERIMTQQIMRVDGEVGPAGEVVWKPVNDKFDQIRMVGSWVAFNNTAGPYLTTNGIAIDFCEISFYGTGLNLVAADYDGTGRDARATVDGGVEGANLLTTPLSAAINLRNYSSNIIIPVVSGLSLGLHTVKIRNVNWLRLSGFEILNISSSIVTSAGQVVSNGVTRTIAASTSAYNSGFESGTLGTRGGRVVVYAKRDGTIGKAVQPVAAASATLTSADHVAANEEVIRSYFWREFGAGRTDDWSRLLGVTLNISFTLDDNTTTLSTQSAQSLIFGGYDSVVAASTNNYLTFTFVGTGLDIFAIDSSPGTDPGIYNVLVDGVSAGQLTTTSAGTNVTKIWKIVSGLPYGTHTVKLLTPTTLTVFSRYLMNYIVYGPKKPSIPTGAMELADYNIMADYVTVSSLAALADKERMATGVLRKSNSREMVFTGTGWISPTNDANNYISGLNGQTSVSGDAMFYTFFGTGCEWRTRQNAAVVVNNTITLNGNPLTTYSATTALITGLTGLTFTSAGAFTGTTAGVACPIALRISGLPLGLYTIKILNNNTTAMYAEAIDVITPIHTHKNNGPFVVNNSLPVGSQGINDGRTLPSPLNEYLKRNSVASDNGLGTGVSTANWFPGKTSGTINIRPGKKLRVDAVIDLVPININEQGGFAIYLDGVRVSYKESTLFRVYTGGGTTGGQISQSETFNVGPGVHHVYIRLLAIGTVSDEGHKVYLTEVD